MSQQLDQFLMVVIALLLVLIVVLIVAMVGLFIYLAKDRGGKEGQSPAPPPMPASPKKVDYVRCSVHLEKKSAGLCAMCEAPFCEDCLKENDKLTFCPEHYRTFLENKWTELETVKTTPDTPKEGIFLYEFKEKLFKEGVPTYIVTHYTINVQEDYIESYVTLFSRAQDQGELKLRLASTARPS